MPPVAFDPRGYPGYLFDLDGTLIDTAPDICAAVNHALDRFGYGPVPASTARHWVGLGGRFCIEQALVRVRAASGSVVDMKPAATDNGEGGTAATRPHGVKSSVPSEPATGDNTGRGPSATETDGSEGSIPNEPATKDEDEQSASTAPQVDDEALIDAMLTPFLDHYRAHIADNSLPYPEVVDALGTLSAQGTKLAVVTNKRIELTRSLLAELELTNYFDVIVGGDSTPNPKPAPDPIVFACEKVGLNPRDILFVGDSLTDVRSARAAGCPVVCVPDGYNQGMAPGELGADAIIHSLIELV